MSVALWPDHLVTLDEWSALPEDTTHRFELVEGTLQVSPRPSVGHRWALSELSYQLRGQLPDHLRALPEVEVVLFDTHPPTVRVPDLIIVSSAAPMDAARCAAAAVRVACEIVSQGSVRTDRITKLAEYADAGIQHYWLVDLTTGGPSVEIYQRHGAGYDKITAHHEGTVAVTVPAPLTVDLSALTG
ncbi:MAG: Uma2 family endonuclease [Streptosporangiaceae bacterium]